MTDDEADELLHPPRQWPPLSAATAAGLLLFPPLVSTIYRLVTRHPMDALIPVVALLIVLRPTRNLLRGDEAGIGGGLGVMALVFLVAIPPVIVRLTIGVGWTDVVWFLPVVSWLLITGFLIWWPATRRWCGMLPPADEDDG